MGNLSEWNNVDTQLIIVEPATKNKRKTSLYTNIFILSKANIFINVGVTKG